MKCLSLPKMCKESRACDVEPYAYLRHALTELPRRQPGDDVTDLLPFNFNKN
jgi:hypothetical protein